MSMEPVQNHSELVHALASTIHKKIVSPAAVKVHDMSLEITVIHDQLDDLEKRLSLLAGAHEQTRLMAVLAGVTTLLLAAFGAFWLIPFLKAHL